MRLKSKPEKPEEYHHLFSCHCTAISPEKLERCQKHSWGEIRHRTIWGMG